MNRVIPFLFFTLLSLSTYAQEELFTVRGEVKDLENGGPMIGAAVTYGEGQGVVVGLDGKFKFELPLGNYLITVSAVSKRTVKKRIFVNKYTELDFLMENDVKQLSEVIVSGSREASTIKSASMGVEQMNIKKIRQIPALMGEVDVIRTMITIPGVSSIGEGAGGINVRGGSVGQNLVVFDGAPIFYTSHLFGFFSVFNQDVVKNVTLYKASIPARYGGRIASVLSVESKSAIPEKASVSGGVGIVSSRLSTTIPIIKDKLGVMVAGRSTYSNYLLTKAKSPEIKNSRASFYDLNGKIDFRPSRNTLISANFYHGGDRFSFDSDTTYSYGNYSSSLKVQQEISEVWNVTAEMTYSNNYSNVEGDFANRNFDLNIKNENYGAKLVVGADFKGNYLEFGGEYNRIAINPGNLQPKDNESIIDPLILPTDNGEEISIFAEDNFELGKFKFITGLRFGIYNKLGGYDQYVYESGSSRSVASMTDTISHTSNQPTVSYYGLEPRFSVNYLINKDRSIKLSYQRTRQNMHLIANNVAIVPTDVYKLSNEYIKPQIGDQVSLGYNQNFKNALYKTSVEVYFKSVQNAIDYKDGATLFLNDHLETEVVSGLGRAYGLELSGEKVAGKWRGKIGYTYSRSLIQASSIYEEENINDGEFYPAYFDKPHDITALISYHPTARLSYNFNFTYSTGRPVSLPTGKFQIGALSVAEFSERNQYRVPDYHRLDISLHYEPYPEKKENTSSFTLGLYNVYGRKNAFSVFFQDVNGSPPQAYKLAILGIPFPYATYNFSF